jgi:peroxiredoxin
MKPLAIKVALGAALALLTAVQAVAGDKEKASSAQIDRPAPAFTLTDISGNEHSLKDFSGKYVVLEWTNFDCPFVRKHYDSGNMQSLQKEYAEEGVVWLRICSSAPGQQGYFESEVIERRLKEDKSMAAAYLVDADGKVGRMYGAKTTPHMYIVDPKGTLIYAGAIDNIKSTNKADIEKATNYVSACLDAALKGEAIAVTTSVPYGCSVKYAKKSSAASH